MPKGYKYEEPKYVIPEYVQIGDKTYSVVQIDKNAFKNLSGLLYSNKIKEIVFPSTLKIIEDWSFYGNGGLENIILPDGLETIGVCAFLDVSPAPMDVEKYIFRNLLNISVETLLRLSVSVKVSEDLAKPTLPRCPALSMRIIVKTLALMRKRLRIMNESICIAIQTNNSFVISGLRLHELP